MIKKVMARAAGGFAYGVLVGQIVAISISLLLGDGDFIQVLPEFRAIFTSEIEAVLVQTILTGVIGTVFATTSTLFEIEKWSFLKQYIVHFLITAAFWIPIVYLIWMPKTTKSIMIACISFMGTYMINWFVQYTISKNDIKKINAKIKADNDQN